MINYRLKIDFLDSKTLASDICFVSGDVKSSTLYFEFYNAGKRVDISGYTLSVRAKRSDGVVVASSGKIKENTAVFTPESNMYCVPGELYMEIALTDATGKYTTTKIITAEVIEGLGEAAIEAVDNLNVYVKLVSDAISAKEEAKAFAEVAKTVHPEIRDGIWWVYDPMKGVLVSSGIKAEGPQGIKGEKGDQGIPGYTPQREIDYWTVEDKNRINKYVDDALEEISDTLNTKIEKTSEHLGEEVENLQNQCSNALKGSVNGEVISITDVSPVEHNLGINVSTKNYANLSQSPFYSFRANIIEQTNDTIKLETTVNGAKWTGAWYELPESLIGKTLTLSGTWEMSNPNSQGALRIQWLSDANTPLGAMLCYTSQSGAVKTFTVSEKPEGATKLALIVYAVADSTNAVAGDTITYKNIQLEKGTTATPYTPFVDVSTATLSTTGKNLFGGEFEIGGIASNGQNYNNPAQIRSNYINISCADYVLSQLDSTYKVSAVFFYDANETMIYVSFATVTTISNTRIVGAKYARFRIARVDGAEITDEDLIKVKSAFQFEIGKAVTEYEPYIEPASYPISADGTVEDVKSIYPNTTLLTDTQGVLIECEYNKDINKVIENLTNAIISLGGNV